MIRAGVSLSLTGRYALQGRQALCGLQLWAAWVNEGGGLPVGGGAPPQSVLLEVSDDRGRIADAQKNVDRLLAEGRADLLFGPYGSDLTLAVGDITEAQGKLLWNHGGSSDAIFSRGWQGVIGGVALASTYFASLPAWLRRTDPEIDSLIVLHAESGTFAGQVVQGLREAAKREGFRRISFVPCEAGEMLSRLTLPKGGGGQAHAVVLAVSLEDEIRMVLHRERFPSEIRRIGAVAAGLAAFGKTLGALAEGVLGSSQWEPDLGTKPEVGPEEAWVLSRFHRAFGQDPEYPAMQAFAMGVVAAECVRQAGSLEGKALRAAAMSLDVTTCFGRFRIDPKTGRQVGHRPLLVEWRDGKKSVVWPSAG